jgi:predicted nucleotidyltransferase
MQPFIAEKREEIAELCRKHHVRRLSIFGSAVRDDFDSARSDVDVRIEFDDKAIERYADNFFNLQDALMELFGRKVDIVSSKTIRNVYFQKAVEQSQVTLYAA